MGKKGGDKFSLKGSQSVVNRLVDSIFIHCDLRAVSAVCTREETDARGLFCSPIPGRAADPRTLRSPSYPEHGHVRSTRTRAPA